VGGDFYVFHQDGDNFLIGVVDCAGHGVPGALMTMLAHAAISHAIAEVGLHDPAAILGRTDTALRAMLSASHLDSALATHADAALIYVDRAAGHMSFSGAKMSLYICDDGWVEEIKGARRPLAHKRMGEFANTALSLTPGRTYYLVTDGYLDQAGGDEGFCFGNDRFKQALQTHADLPLTEQSDAFAETLARYQRSQPQRDDITIVSFRPI
jgi:serine phosphatase RsbU (regulator of sigma subunit)